MPRSVNTELRVGNGPRRVAIGTETRYIMGSAEGPWWFKFSWWVIPLGLLLILGPWVLILRSDNKTSATAVMYQPVAHPAPVSTPVPKVQPISPPQQLTPEERAEQYKEERRRQYGIQ